jgi:large subunit ribosomal protein L17
MRHRNSGRKFGRKSGPRRALERGIVQGLFEHGRITTTLARAKEFRSPAEKLITLARRGNAAKEKGDGPGHLHCFRMAVAELGGNRQANRLAKRLFEEIAPQFRDRNGGYTRVVRHARGRFGDNAPIAIFELVGYTPAAPEPEGESPEAEAAAAKGAADGGGAGKAPARKGAAKGGKRKPAGGAEPA